MTSEQERFARNMVANGVPVDRIRQHFPWASRSYLEKLVAEQNGDPPSLDDAARAIGEKEPVVRLVSLSEIKMTRPSWVWEARVAAGGVTLLAGLEGLGKTVVMGDVMAAITRGELAGDRFGSQGTVVYVGHEDDWGSVMKPRLVTAVAVQDRVKFVELPDGDVFAADTHLEALATALESIDDVALIVIDPLDAHLGESVDSHRKSEVQRAVSKLARLAQLYGCGVVGIGHINKNELSRDVLMRIIGSKGFTTGPRSVLALGEHPDNAEERVLVLAKTNLVDKYRVPALRFRLEGREVPDDEGVLVSTAAVVWLGEESGVDPNTVVRAPSDEERTARDEAADWLRAVLKDGKALTSKEVKGMARDADIAEATLKRALSLAGVIVERDETARGRPSTWRIEVPGHEVSDHGLALNGDPKSNAHQERRFGSSDRVSDHGSVSGDGDPKPRRKDEDEL